MDYKVQRGDTLSALAKRHGTTVNAIMDANQGTIVDRNKIYTGDTITIPDEAKAAAKAVQPDAPKPDPAPQVDANAGAAEVAAAPTPATPPAPSLYEQPATQVVYEVYASPVAPQPATTQVMGARSDDVQVVEMRPTTVAPASYEDHAYEQRVVDLVNQIRGQYGLSALSYDARLDQGAEGHTAQQATVGLMGHEGIGDGTPQDRMLATGWNWAWGENAAVGQTTPEQVVAEWMASPGHRANILNGDFRFLSVGYNTAADGRPYWTQSFGVGS